MNSAGAGTLSSLSAARNLPRKTGDIARTGNRKPRFGDFHSPSGGNAPPAKLTLFLREPGAPLDNKSCDRALKKAILHRKNALFYRTLNGARVGDLFMSLITTAEGHQIEPFPYPVALQRLVAAVVLEPSAWMPWNHPQAPAAAESGPAAN